MIAQDEIKKLFEYKEGKLHWKISRSNVIKVGDRAGTKVQNGYIQISIDGEYHKEHRLIFLFHKGYLPEFIDHIDTVKDNNLIENLRECTRSQNAMNKGLQSNNTSGTVSVYYDYYANKQWNAYLNKDGKRVLNKYFYTKEEAIKARLEAEQKYFGEFAKKQVEIIYEAY